MNQSPPNNQTGRSEPPKDVPEPPGGSGPLQRRIMTGPQALIPVVVPERCDTTAVATQYATVALLDGTVVARLACDASLGRIAIGRGSLASIQIHDPFVHRVHSEIQWDTETRSHIITHAGGSNGTFVNLQRVDTPTRLIDGARIRVGKTELIYRRVYYPGG